MGPVLALHLACGIIPSSTFASQMAVSCFKARCCLSSHIFLLAVMGTGWIGDGEMPPAFFLQCMEVSYDT